MTAHRGDPSADRTARLVTAPDGRTLCVAEWGDPDGQVVISLHGTPGCRLFSTRRIDNGFDDGLRAVGVRLVTYDRPGYGRSDRLAGRSVADCVGDVAAIADAVGVDRFAVEGGSAGGHHALAVAALLPARVSRVAAVAPMAPLDQLGKTEWSRGQDDEVRAYVAACLAGESSMVEAITREDTAMRASASVDDPRAAEVFEQTRAGIWGWVDDETAAFKPWGFAAAGITVPTQVWYDPNDPVLPPQHAAWLGRAISDATLVPMGALGHGSQGDPKPEWARLYSWLIDA